MQQVFRYYRGVERARSITVNGVAMLSSKSSGACRIQARSLYVLVAGGTFPEPDGRVGRTLYWKASTIDKWKRTRRKPGRPPSSAS